MYRIISEDVTRFEGDAILNSLGYGPTRVVDVPGGVFSAILSRANDPEALSHAVYEQGASLPFTHAFLTDSYGLPCRKIAHVISPFRVEDDKELSLLRTAYANVLKLVYDAGLHCICLPLIGTGANGYSPEQSFLAARKSAYEFEKSHPDFDVYVTVFWGENPRERFHRESQSEREDRRRVESRDYNERLRAKQRADFGVCPIPSHEIDMECLPLEVGDSFGRLIDLFLIAREGSDDKKVIDDGWEGIAMCIGDAKDDYFEDEDAWFGGNSKFQWHKHADAKKGRKKTPGIPKGVEDPNGIWNTPKKLSILLVACALNLTRKQTDFLFRFCGYYLSEYSKEDLAIRACYEFLADENEPASILNVYQLYSFKVGITPFVAKKEKK